MTRSARDLAYLAVLGVVLGAIVHLTSMLAVPALAARDADARLAALAPRHVLTLLPPPDDPAGNGLDIPERDPAAVMAVCRFDVTSAPVRLRAMAGDTFLSLAFHSPGKGVFYALTDRSAARGQIDVVVVTQRQLEVLQAGDPEDEPIRELRLLAPSPTGFVSIRALALEPGQMADAEAAVRAVQCGPEALPARARPAASLPG